MRNFNRRDHRSLFLLGDFEYDKNKKKKEVKSMVVISEENIMTPEISEESFNCAEIHDCGNFFIPGEIYISEKDIAW